MNDYVFKALMGQIKANPETDECDCAPVKGSIYRMSKWSRVETFPLMMQSPLICMDTLMLICDVL